MLVARRFHNFHKFMKDKKYKHPCVLSNTKLHDFLRQSDVDDPATIISVMVFRFRRFGSNAGQAWVLAVSACSQ